MTRLPLLLTALLLACEPPGGVAPRDSDAAVDSPSDSRPTDPETIPGDTAACPALLISEVVSSNRDSLEDGAGDSPDWIELYNASGVSQELSGWSLSDDPDDPGAWRFPAVDLPAGAFLLVFASGKEGEEIPQGELHASFRLSADGELLLLSCPLGLADSLEVPALDEDLAYGRAQAVSARALLQAGDTARFAVDPPAGFEAAGFDDSAWRDLPLGVGFDGVDSDAEPTNVALLAATSQSSDGYSRTGAQAVDGDLDTFSHTADADLEPWWQVELGGLWSVSSVKLHNRLNCCPERLYNITVSLLDADGGELWVSETLNPTDEGSAPVDPGEQLEVRLDEPVVAAAVRVSKLAVNGASSSEWLSLAEVEVMGVEASPYTDSIVSDVGAWMQGVSARAGLRSWVELPGSAPDRVELALAYDDAFALWLDGEPLAASHTLGHGQASGEHSGAEAESFALEPGLFAGGEALLAFELQNIAADDDDLLLAPTVSAQWLEQGEPAFFSEPTPGAPNGEGWAGVVQAPEPSHPRGFYDAPFELELGCATPGAAIAYTTDGSTPSADHGTLVEPVDAHASVVATIPIDTTTVLRAVALREGWGDSPVVAHSFLFLEDVIRQPAAPEGYPGTWDGMSQSAVSADYEMDPEVVDDPAYHDDLLTGLRAIPTVSIALDPDDLFGAEDGIYVHSLQRGEEWERAASVELIETDGTGFQVHCGLRVHGYGWRYHSSTKKHAFRLEFSSAYGPRSLSYPLFPDSDAERYDSIVLRSQGSRGWQDFRDPEQSQYLRDAFARDTARDMGKVDGHGRHVHLYLDGLYWGLYQLVERPDASFGERYFGGDDDDYDAINRRTTTNEAIDGTLDAYNELLALADQDVTDPAVWGAIQAVLDVDDLIDYMLIHQYTVNRDGPCCYSHNNMRGVRERRDGALWRWFVWDMEYSIWDASDATNIDIDVSGSISHVYARLRENSEFRARYAERAAMHLGPGGALTAEACTARWEARSAEIQDAIVAESARWGDTDREPPYTRDVEWMEERTRLLEGFFPHRSAYLEQQLIQAGLL
jgi:hypothetical protein